MIFHQTPSAFDSPIDGMHADSDGREYLSVKLTIHRHEDPALFELLTTVSPRRRSKLAMATLRNALTTAEPRPILLQHEPPDVAQMTLRGRYSTGGDTSESRETIRTGSTSTLTMNLDGLGL